MVSIFKLSKPLSQDHHQHEDIELRSRNQNHGFWPERDLDNTKLGCSRDARPWSQDHKTGHWLVVVFAKTEQDVVAVVADETERGAGVMVLQHRFVVVQQSHFRTDAQQTHSPVQQQIRSGYGVRVRSLWIRTREPGAQFTKNLTINLQ